MSDGKKPKLAVYKFSSCDGCQLSLLDCEDELLEIADAIEIAYFMEARRRTLSGPYDVTLVEGSVTTEEEIEHIKEVREQSRLLVSIGACATAGGIQALRNWVDVQDFVRTVYATPEYIHTLDESRPISDFVNVDFELQGCPISKEQLLELVSSVVFPESLPTAFVSSASDGGRSASLWQVVNLALVRRHRQAAVHSVLPTIEAVMAVLDLLNQATP